MPSFDVVSEVDLHAFTNAVDQASRVIETRFDFKGVDAGFERKERTVTLHAEAEFQLAQMLDILMQRMPAAAGAPVAAAPVAQPAPAPQVTELLDVIQSLKAQNAEMMTALQERLREPVAAEAPAPKTVVPSAPKTAQTTAEADARARKAGIFSSPRRKAEAPAVAEAPVQEELAHEAPAPEAPAPEAPAPEAAPPSAEGSAPAPAPAAAPAEAPKSGPISVKIVRTRDMQAPAGYAPEPIDIVSSDNVKFPWRVLMPTGTNTVKAAR